MDLKQLEYFTAVAEEGTFQAAAQKLHMTQPPLSVQIRLLEEEIGAPLFLRGPRHASLTEAGRLLYNRAKDLLELQNITRQELSDFVSGSRGLLRLGIASSANGELLTRMILPFTKCYPDIRFELTESNTYRLLELLAANLLDVALIRTPFPAAKDFSVHNLFEDRIVAVFQKDRFQTLTEKKSTDLSLSMLSSHPLIIYRRWKSVLDHAFSDLGLSPEYFCIADDARTCLAWAEAGLGVAIVPHSAALLSAGSVITCPITKPEITSAVCLVTRGSSYVPASLQLFLDTVLPENQTSSSSQSSSSPGPS